MKLKPIPLPKRLETNFSKYKIYAYKEGKRDNKFSYSDFNGFPVIFIPGSSGSYKQVRSFASVSMNFFRHYSTKSHLDYFSIDFNGQLSGVYGPYLQNQTVFLSHAIKVIKRIYYKKNEKDNKLIVISHSFGGIIFKGLINLPSFRLEDIFLFLSLATPHRRSVFAFDSSFYTYYSAIDKRLKTDLVIYEKYQNVAKISIGGGLNDLVVRSDLTDTEPELNQWSLTTNSLPEVWVTADHQCIVWCRQLIKKLVHLIFDLLEERLNDEKMLNRNRIIEHHLDHRFNDRLTPRYRKLRSTLDLASDKKSKQYEIEKRIFNMNRLKVIDTLIYKFKFVQNTFFSIISTNLYRSDWIYACRLDHCDNLQNYTNLPIPSTNEFNGIKRNHFLLDSNFYINQNYSKLALKISPSTIKTAFQIERIIQGRRNKEVNLPSFLNRFLWFFNPFQTILKISVAEESTFYNLTLNNFDQIWHNYNLKLEIKRCYPEAKEEIVMFMRVPWYREDRFYAIEPKKDTTFSTNLNLNVPKYDGQDQRKITIGLILDPYCEYKLRVKFSLRETIIQLFRHYSFLFLPISASILLSAYAVQIQLKSINSEINELIQKKNEHYLTLKSILTNNINEVTFFGFQPALPYLIHFTVNKLIHQLFDYPNFLESNLLFIKFTRHQNDSHINALFSSYLIYIFIYFILFIIIHFLSYFFSLIINFNQFIYLNRNQLQYKTQLLSFYIKPYSSNSKSFLRLILILAFLILIYLKLIVYFLVSIYLFKIIHISTQNTSNQKLIGLTKSTTQFYLEITKFLLTLVAFLPLAPKFIVWLTTDELIFDRPIILFKIGFTISLIQLYFQSDNEFDKRSTLLSCIIKFFAIICLCLASIDYTVITISLVLILIICSVFKLKDYKFRILDQNPDQIKID